jgi:hypothetical protein
VPVLLGAENLAPTRIPSLDHPACSKLLYQPCYPGPRVIIRECKTWHPHESISITVILTIAPYQCETLFLTLIEELKVMVFENRILRKIFWPKKQEIKGDCIQ